MNNLDKQYTDLLQDILTNGVVKKDRTGTGTKSVFGREIRHNMKDGFPLLTTKKMYFKGIATELIWFLRGDTNIKYLVDNDCHIWDGDAYKNYCKLNDEVLGRSDLWTLTKEEFIEKIKTDNEFANKWGDLGPIYGKQWRKWEYGDLKTFKNGKTYPSGEYEYDLRREYIDQMAELIKDLKNNPDSRRLMVSAWNVAEINAAVLPPCHYGFQCWTRELTLKERYQLFYEKQDETWRNYYDFEKFELDYETGSIKLNGPERALSLQWNQRSVDTFLGLPFNIASYGLLLEILAKEVNMVPDELIGSLGDTHIYLNHFEQAQEQIGNELMLDERFDIWFDSQKPNRDVVEYFESLPTKDDQQSFLDEHSIAKKSREPYPLPKLNITEREGQTFSALGELYWDNFQIQGYQPHPSIKAKLSN